MDAIPYRNDIALEASRQGHARVPELAGPSLLPNGGAGLGLRKSTV